MPYTPGYSVVEGAKGAEAMGKIIAQPDITEAAQAEAKYTTAKYEALQKYMKGAPSGDLGRTNYGVIKDSQELAQAKAKLQQEEDRAQGLPPEERAKLDQHFDRQQRLIDKKEQAVATKANQHMDATAAIYSNIDSPESLEQARPFLEAEIRAKAEAAIEGGDIHPSNKEQFIQDELKKALPAKWDERSSPQFIGTKLDAMKSFKEQTADRLARVKEQHEETYREKSLAQQKIANLNTARQIQSQNLGYLKAESASIDASAKDSARMLQEYAGKDAKLATEERNIRTAQQAIKKIILGSGNTPGIPKEIITTHGLLPSTKEPNPEYTKQVEELDALSQDLADIKARRTDLAPRIEEAEVTHRQAVTNADTVRAMMGFKPLPKQVTIPKVPPMEDKAETPQKMTEARIIAELKTHFPNKSNEELRQMATEAGDIKEDSSKKEIPKEDTKKEKQIISAAQESDLTPLQKSKLIDEAIKESGKAFGNKIADLFEYR